jgi:hypothetical protein
VPVRRASTTVTAGWCVRVTVFDDLVVSISERGLAGRDLSEADEELIRDCARYLLSFVGQPRAENYSCVECGCRMARPGLCGECSCEDDCALW